MMSQRPATELPGLAMSRPANYRPSKMSLLKDRTGEASWDRLSQSNRHFYAPIIS
jgi:hypothetical protein